MSNSIGRLIGMHLAPTFVEEYTKNGRRYTEIVCGICYEPSRIIEYRLRFTQKIEEQLKNGDKNVVFYFNFW